MGNERPSTISEHCFDHSPGDTFCKECGLEIDEYGNTEDDFRYCSYPDCGCDGSRLCMAKEGASERCFKFNKEGMWSGSDWVAKNEAVKDILTTHPVKK